MRGVVRGDQESNCRKTLTLDRLIKGAVDLRYIEFVWCFLAWLYEEEKGKCG